MNSLANNKTIANTAKAATAAMTVTEGSNIAENATTTTKNAGEQGKDGIKSKPQRDDSKMVETPRGTRTLGIFNAEDFLSRAQMNDKINNILRSPTKAPNGVRQRSVYTNITPAPVPNIRYQSAVPLSQPHPHPEQQVAAAAAAQQLHRSSSSSLLGLDRNNSSGISVGSGTASFNAKESSSQTNAQVRPSYMAMHMNGLTPQPHFANPFDAGLVARPPLPRGIFGSRYAPLPSTGYTYDNDGAYRMPQAHHAQQFPAPMPPPPYAIGRIAQRGLDFENITPPSCPGSGPIAMSNGTIQLRLRDGIRIDMTLDKAVRVLNQRSMVAIALSRNCSNSALIHPNGRILQSGSKVEIVTYDGMKTNNFVRYAKMWYKGVSFTSESCALIYLVDTAGTRTTTDTFTDLSKDYTLAVFYDDSRHGPSFVQDANEVIQTSSYSCSDDGTEIYDINGFRITQAADGLVKVTRTHNKCLIRTSPGNGSATLTTPGIHCTASLGKTSHLFVRRNEKRMHFDGSCFIVRNAGHSAGFNENNLLIVY